MERGCLLATILSRISNPFITQLDRQQSFAISPAEIRGFFQSTAQALTPVHILRDTVVGLIFFRLLTALGVFF